MSSPFRSGGEGPEVEGGGSRSERYQPVLEVVNRTEPISILRHRPSPSYRPGQATNRQWS